MNRESPLPSLVGLKGINDPIECYALFSASEGPAAAAGVGAPLRDYQYFLRAEVMRRFAYLWLRLDQLPRGSWGRSVRQWMNSVWQGIPGLTPNALIEDEGGFETTLLNVAVLCEVHTAREAYERLASTAISYVLNRHHDGGFGPHRQTRAGYVVDSQPRHTALATAVLGRVLLANLAVEPPEIVALFRSGMRALLLGADVEQVRELLLPRLTQYREAAQPVRDDVFPRVFPVRLRGR